METRKRIAGIPGCTSNMEAKAACRSETRKGRFHLHDAFVADEPGEPNRTAGANGSTQWRYPNCVHYVREPVGEHLKYLVCANGQAIACLAWSSAVRHLSSRDRFIGWSAEVRKRNLHLLAYNSRFLILPWVEVPHLASHILGRMAKLLLHDWQRLYAHPVYWLETFVDPARFQGTCYRAANWLVLGAPRVAARTRQAKSARGRLRKYWRCH
jgi:Domain of unknown function (DUF4338)